MNQSKKKGKKRVFVIIAVALTLLLGGGYYLWRQAGERQLAASISQEPQIKTMELQRGTIMNSASSSGTVDSANIMNVYTTQNFPIKEVSVKVGDIVKAGDVLARLDMSSLDYDIQQAEINLANAYTSIAENYQSIANSVQNADISVASSKLSLEKQQQSYDTLKEQIDNETHTDLVNAQNSIDTAQKSIDSANKALEEKKGTYESELILYNAGSISKSELDTAKKAVDDAEQTCEQAQSDYQKALDNYERIKANLAQSLLTSEKDLESSNLNYQNALNSKAQAQEKSSSSSVESQRLSLEKLQSQRAEDEITAPIDGTITEVNAVVGNSPSGILFVVEDMNDLYVSTYVKEFRIGNISIGQDALITTDATGSQVFPGKVEFISPKAAEGSSTTNVEFEVHVSIDGDNPNLRIGMNGFVNIILETAEDVYIVPADAVMFKMGGSSIYALENGSVIEIPVTVGIENDTQIEISGDGIRDGMAIVMNPSEVAPGQSFGADLMAGASMTMTSGGAVRMPPEEREAMIEERINSGDITPEQAEQFREGGAMREAGGSGNAVRIREGGGENTVRMRNGAGGE